MRAILRPLIRLLAAHVVLTLVVWAPVYMLAHADLGISNVYLASSLTLLSLYRVRRFVRRRRRSHR